MSPSTPSAIPPHAVPPSPDGETTGPVRPWIVEALGLRALHTSHDAVQSVMRLDAPDALALAYTRTMMGVLLCVPRPRRIALVGLGGGTLVKFCHRHLAPARIDVAEINPHVLALRETFHVPPDDDRLQVALADATAWIRTLAADTDVLLVDGFDPEGLPPALGAQAFFDDAAAALADGGVLAMNLPLDEPTLPQVMERLARAFGHACAEDGGLLWLDGVDDSNRIAYAWRGRTFRQAAPARLQLPASLPIDEARELCEDLRPLLAAWRTLRAGGRLRPDPGHGRADAIGHDADADADTEPASGATRPAGGRRSGPAA